jgi:predicted neuraminidase
MPRVPQDRLDPVWQFFHRPGGKYNGSHQKAWCKCCVDVWIEDMLRASDCTNVFGLNALSEEQALDHSTFIILAFIQLNNTDH